VLRARFFTKRGDHGIGKEVGCGGDQNSKAAEGVTLGFAFVKRLVASPSHSTSPDEAGGARSKRGFWKNSSAKLELLPMANVS
jgi:hypothetical protein